MDYEKLKIYRAQGQTMPLTGWWVVAMVMVVGVLWQRFGCYSDMAVVGMVVVVVVFLLVILVVWYPANRKHRNILCCLKNILQFLKLFSKI